MNAASKLFIAICGLAMVFAGAYGMAARGATPVTLLVTVAIGAALAIVVTTAVGGRDFAPAVPLDAPPPERAAHTPGPAAAGSMWPLTVAAGAGLVALGAAIGLEWIVGGLILAALGAGGWYGHTWREHPSWTPRVSQRMTSRVVLPAALFWAVLACVLITAIAISRILLAVPEKASVAVALVIAVVLLVAFFVVAARPRTPRAVLTPVVAVTVLALGGAAIASGVKGERHYELAAEPVPTSELVARNVAFSPGDFNAKAGERFTVAFRNEDRGTYHNFSIYEQQSDGTQGTPVYNGKPINGGKIVYTFTAPTTPGAYIFACDFHANMRGVFTVASS